MVEIFDERMSKRRRGYPSEIHVRIGGGETRLGEAFVERLGRKDPWPCGSGNSFKECHLKDPRSSWRVGDDYWR